MLTYNNTKAYKFISTFTNTFIYFFNSLFVFKQTELTWTAVFLLMNTINYFNNKNVYFAFLN